MSGRAGGWAGGRAGELVVATSRHSSCPPSLCSGSCSMYPSLALCESLRRLELALFDATLRCSLACLCLPACACLPVLACFVRSGEDLTPYRTASKHIMAVLRRFGPRPLTFLPPPGTCSGEDLTPYRTASKHIMAVLRRYGPAEKLGLDEVFVDATAEASCDSTRSTIMQYPKQHPVKCPLYPVLQAAQYPALQAIQVVHAWYSC